MESALKTVSFGELGAARERDVELLHRRFSSMPEQTRRAHVDAQRDFKEWALSKGHFLPHIKETHYSSMMADLTYQYVRGYLTERRKEDGTEYSLSTVRRRLDMLSSQAEQLKKAGVISENYVRASRASELLSTGTKELTKKHRAKALTKEQLLKLIAACEVDAASKEKSVQLKGIRDKAILLFTFAAGGRRRSEVAQAQFDYLESREGGYLYTVQKSKTDQQGEGLTVPVQGIAAAALTRWLNEANISTGPLFRRFIKGGKVSHEALSDHSINIMVKERAIEAGLNPSHYSAHSLRAGFMTEGALQGLHVRELMQLSGHSDINTALTYVRPGEASNSRAARLLG